LAEVNIIVTFIVLQLASVLDCWRWSRPWPHVFGFGLVFGLSCMASFDVTGFYVYVCSLECLRQYWARCSTAIHSSVPRRSASQQSSALQSSSWDFY